MVLLLPAPLYCIKLIIIIIIIIIMFIYPPNNDVIKSITCYKIARTRNWQVVLIHSTRTLPSVLSEGIDPLP
jgi:hypothetical protein